MAPRTMQASTKSVGGPAVKRNAKKRAAPSDSDATKQVADTPATPGKEKPVKRPRTSTISNVKVAESSSTAGVATKKDIAIRAAPTPASKGSVEVTKEKSKDDEPKLVGTFDLYGMKLPFLNKIYSPAGSDKVFPEKLYNEILTYQAKNDRTAKITIPEDFTSEELGKFRSSNFSDPMEDLPYDIAITNIEEVKASELELDLDYERPADDWTGPGLQADLQLEEESCGIASSSGEISLRPLWKKVGKDEKVMELFEGIFSFEISYSRLYSRKGHGEGQDLTLAFWAVRSKA